MKKTYKGKSNAKAIEEAIKQGFFKCEKCGDEKDICVLNPYDIKPRPKLVNFSPVMVECHKCESGKMVFMLSSPASLDEAKFQQSMVEKAIEEINEIAKENGLPFRHKIPENMKVDYSIDDR